MVAAVAQLQQLVQGYFVPAVWASPVASCQITRGLLCMTFMQERILLFFTSQNSLPCCTLQSCKWRTYREQQQRFKPHRRQLEAQVRTVLVKWRVWLASIAGLDKCAGVIQNAPVECPLCLRETEAVHLHNAQTIISKFKCWKLEEKPSRLTCNASPTVVCNATFACANSHYSSSKQLEVSHCMSHLN